MRYSVMRRTLLQALKCMQTSNEHKPAQFTSLPCDHAAVGSKLYSSKLVETGGRSHASRSSN